jgi:Uma2 family endonuclease
MLRWTTMNATALKLPSFEDLYAEIQAMPEGVTGEILEPGVIHKTMGRPGRPHRYSAKQALMALRRFDVDQGGAGWWIEVECEVRFGPRMLDPDLAGWRLERVPELPEDNPIAILPDWTCEILSPSTARTDRTVKLPRYAKEGVSWIWLVDPFLHTIEVYASEKGRAYLAMTAEAGDALVLPPFDRKIAVGSFWLPVSGSPAAPKPAATRPKGKRPAKAKHS